MEPISNNNNDHDGDYSAVFSIGCSYNREMIWNGIHPHTGEPLLTYLFNCYAKEVDAIRTNGNMNNHKLHNHYVTTLAWIQREKPFHVPHICNVNGDILNVAVHFGLLPLDLPDVITLWRQYIGGIVLFFDCTFPCENDDIQIPPWGGDTPIRETPKYLYPTRYSHEANDDVSRFIHFMLAGYE